MTDKPKRRWYQFYISHLLVLTTVVAIVCGAVVRVRQTRNQREAVSVVWRMRGLTAYEESRIFTAPLSESDYARRMRGRGWISDLIGEDQPIGVLFPTTSRLSNEKLDPLIEALQRMPELKVVFLESTQVTDEGVKKLQEALPDCQVEHEPTPFTIRP